MINLRAPGIRTAFILNVECTIEAVWQMLCLKGIMKFSPLPPEKFMNFGSSKDFKLVYIPVLILVFAHSLDCFSRYSPC